MARYKVNLSPEWHGHKHEEEFEDNTADCEVAVTQGYLIPLDRIEKPQKGGRLRTFVSEPQPEPSTETKPE